MGSSAKALLTKHVKMAHKNNLPMISLQHVAFRENWAKYFH